MLGRSLGRVLVSGVVCMAAIDCTAQPQAPLAAPASDDGGVATLEPGAGDRPARVFPTDDASVATPSPAGDANEEVEEEEELEESAPPGLVINEVDYDQVGTDEGEFVEILNTSPSPIALDGIALVLVYQAAEYGRVPLSGTLEANGYLVVASPWLAVASGAQRIEFGAVANNLRNTGPAAVGLLDVASGKLLDSLSYEGDVLAATVTGVAQPVDFAETAGAVDEDSNSVDVALIRSPNGDDTDDNEADWFQTAIKTPGAANVLAE